MSHQCHRSEPPPELYLRSTEPRRIRPCWWSFGITTSLRVSAKLAAVSAALLAAVLVAYNNLINLWPPFQRLYVRINACAAAAVTGLALGPLNLEPLAVGLTGNTLLEAGAGAAAGVILTCPLCPALASPRWAKLIADRRLDDVDVRELLQRIFYRVPLGTALLEELAFEVCCLACSSTTESRRPP
jgi:hypothetical protein